MAKKKHRPTSDRDLKQLVLKWQKRLRLMDWDIEAFFDTDEMQECEAWAMCNAQGFLRSATMRFQHPDYAKLRQPNFDLECVVIHEILHIFFAGIRHRDYAGLMLEEQMVHTMAIMLISLERNGKNAGPAKSWDTLDTLNLGAFCCSRHSVQKERHQEGLD
jgi:hypothetical protein